jgi:hypothetical protein
MATARERTMNREDVKLFDAYAANVIFAMQDELDELKGDVIRIGCNELNERLKKERLQKAAQGVMDTLHDPLRGREEIDFTDLDAALKEVRGG